MRKKDDIIITVLFAGFLMILLLGGIFLKDKVFSDNENRMLQQAPKFTAERVLSGAFEEDFQRYMDDQVPLRNQWISAKTALQRLLLKKDIGGVYLGKDGWFIEKLTEEQMDHQQFLKNLQGIKSFYEELPSDMEKSVMLVPTTGAVMGDKLPGGAACFDEAAYAKEAAQQLTNCGYVDLYETFSFIAGRGNTQLYYRKDHHWTTDGAAIAFGVWKPWLDFLGTEENVLTEDFQGTLYSKVLWDDGHRDTISAFTALEQDGYKVTADGKALPGGMYQRQFLEKKDKYAVFFGGNYGRLAIETGKKETGQNLLIIKDSFANCFAPLAAYHYDNVYMVDLRYFSGNLAEYAAEQGITEVLTLYSMENMINDRNLSALSAGGMILS